MRAVQAELQAERSETSRLRDLVMQLENRQKALEERLGKTTALLDSTQTDALAANAKLYQAEKMRLSLLHLQHAWRGECPAHLLPRAACAI